MKRAAYHICFFLSEIGRQNDLLFSGMGAPYPGPHLWKTRTGFRSAWLFARLRCDIRFGTL